MDSLMAQPTGMLATCTLAGTQRSANRSCSYGGEGTMDCRECRDIPYRASCACTEDASQNAKKPFPVPRVRNDMPCHKARVVMTATWWFRYARFRPFVD